MFSKAKIFIFIIFLIISQCSYVEAKGTTNNSESKTQEIIEYNKPLLPYLPLINQSLSLEEAISFGIKNNHDIKVAQSGLKVKQSLLKEALSKKWPVLSLGSQTFLRAWDSQVLMNPEMNMTTGESNLFQDFSLNAKMPLFTGGMIKAGIINAKTSVELSNTEINQAIIDTAFEIRKYYLDVLLSKEKISVYNTQINFQKSLLKNVEERYKVGGVIKADVLRLKSEIANIQQVLNQEEISLSDSMFDLKAKIGLDLDSNILLNDSLSFNDKEIPSTKELAKVVLENHPRIIEAKKQIELAKTNIKLAKSNYYPQIYGQITGNIRVPKDPPMMGSGVIGMVSASMPVFDKRINTNVITSKNELDKAEQILKTVEIDLVKQLAKLTVELEINKKNIELTIPSLNETEEDLRLSNRRYEVGRSILLEVQESAKQLEQAKLNKLQAIYNYKLTESKLLQASGQI